jgi:hypothetical protein
MAIARGAACFASLVICVFASQSAIAQPSVLESRIAVLLKTAGRVLRAADTTVSSSQRNALADSLAMFAVSTSELDRKRSFDRDRSSPSLEAVIAITDAGLPQRNRRYDGAVPRLVRIAESAVDMRIRGAALSGLAQMPDSALVAAAFGRIASSASPVAYAAAQHLISYGAKGDAVLRDLYRNNRAVDPTVKSQLAAVARERKY